MTETRLDVENLHKAFILHLRSGQRRPILAGVSLRLHAGECVTLDGPSGTGKSTLLRCIYANYRTDQGRIRVRHEGQWIDLAATDPRTILTVRRRSLGYISQFLRAPPRVGTQAIVAEPLRAAGWSDEQANARAAALLERLGLPSDIWDAPPASFSGGEQQRVNIARGLVADWPVLLVDEPTAGLDPANRRLVLDAIHHAKDNGTAILGIFHDEPARQALADRTYDMQAAPVDRIAN
jgi:alpha-D-ribose 1-methylphosphonate 5-triphosphate synthase subunit PhnL